MLRDKCYMHIISQRWSSKISQIRNPARFQFFLHLKRSSFCWKPETFWHNVSRMMDLFIFLLRMKNMIDSLLKLLSSDCWLQEITADCKKSLKDNLQPGFEKYDQNWFHIYSSYKVVWRIPNLIVITFEKMFIIQNWYYHKVFTA